MSELKIQKAAAAETYIHLWRLLLSFFRDNESERYILDSIYEARRLIIIEIMFVSECVCVYCKEGGKTSSYHVLKERGKHLNHRGGYW